MELNAAAQRQPIGLKKRGPVLVVFLLAAGLAAALAAVWNQHRQTHKSIDFWGADIAHWIDSAPTVLLVPLGEVADKPRAIASISAIASRRHFDISQARGLIHFRRSVLEDTNFDWDASIPRSQGVAWDFAVRFVGPGRSLTILFDVHRGLIANAAAIDQLAALTPKTTRGLSEFFNEQLLESQ
jgi:hypothetical protein